MSQNMGGKIRTLLALLHGANAPLKLIHMAPQQLCLAHLVQLIRRAIRKRALGRSRLDIQPRSKRAVAGAAEHDGAEIGVVADLVEDGAELEPDGLRKGVEAGLAVDFNVGDEFGGRGDADVFV